jgi:hypothetical protein
MENTKFNIIYVKHSIENSEVSSKKGENITGGMGEYSLVETSLMFV